MKTLNLKQILAALFISLFLMSGCKEPKGSKPGPATNNPADKNPTTSQDNQMLDTE